MPYKGKNEHSAPKLLLTDMPCKNTEVEVRHIKVGDVKVPVLWNSEATNYFLVGEDELYVWEKLDGETSLADIVERFNLERGEISAEEVLSFAQNLVEQDLATIEGYKVVKRKARDWFIEVFSFNTERFFELPFFDFLEKIKPKYTLLSSFAFIILVLVLCYNDLVRLILSSSTYSFMGSTIIGWLFYIYVVTIPVFAIHEFFHAIACRMCNVSPGKFGFGILYLNTVFFTSADEIIFAEKAHRIFVQIAGILGNLVTGFAALLFFHFLGSGPYNIISMFTFFSLTIALMNLFPFLRSDGYYVLTDLFDFPALGPETWQYFLSLIKVRKLDKNELLTKKRFIKAYLVIGFLCLFVLIILNAMWIFQILWGPDGFLKVIVKNEPIPPSTVMGLLYLGTMMTVFIIQLWNKYR